MFERNRDPQDFHAEVEAHLKLEADRLREEGLTDDEALHAARRAFGNVTQARERFYERGRWLWWDHLCQDVRFGLRTLRKNPGFTAIAMITLALGTGLVFGLLPALRSSGIAPAEVLKKEAGNASGGRRKARLTGALVVSQLALSLFLLVTVVLFIRGFRKAQGFNPGFNPDHVLVASDDLYAAGYTMPKGLEFDRQLLAKLDAVPGIQSATLADAVPLGFVRNTEMVKFEGYAPQAHEAMDIRSAIVGPNYLRTMQIPLVEDRDFTLGTSKTHNKSPSSIKLSRSTTGQIRMPSASASGPKRIGPPLSASLAIATTTS